MNGFFFFFRGGRGGVRGGGLPFGGFGSLTGNLRLLLQQSRTSFAAARLALHI